MNCKPNMRERVSGPRRWRMHGLYPKSLTETKCTANGNGWRDGKKKQKTEEDNPPQTTRSPANDSLPKEPTRRSTCAPPPLPNHQQSPQPMTPPPKHQRRTQEVNTPFPSSNTNANR